MFLRVRILGLLLVTVAPLFSSCRSTGKAQVADFEAEYEYQQDRYDRRCIKLHDSGDGCRKMWQYLTELQRFEPDPKTGVKVKAGLIPLANRVQKIGALPDQERRELEAIFKSLRGLP